MNFIIDIPKKENLGEDAPPIYISAINRNKSVVAVFDGLGGSGSTLYEENGITHTGAYIASREVHNTIFQYFKNLIDSPDFEINSEARKELKHKIKSELEEKLKKQKFEQSKLKSSLIRTFPTTLALAIVTQKLDISEIDLLWAGDSRVYILNPSKGLIQLTKDDLKIDNDPFENIENDSPLSNMIHLDDDFSINYLKKKFDIPFFVIAATDGCFGYYPTPMHFEYLLINSLFKSNSESDWKENIISELKSISGDDFSMSIKYIDNNHLKFDEIKVHYKGRKRNLRKEYIDTIYKTENELNKLRTKEKELLEKISKLEKNRRDLYKSLWDKYKITNYPNNKIDNK